MLNVAAIANQLTKAERKALRAMPIMNASSDPRWRHVYRLYTLDLVEQFQSDDQPGMRCTELGQVVRDYVGND